MSYVYVPPAPSQRAQRLAQEISGTIEKFRRENPDTSAEDVRSALRLAARGTPTSRSRETVVALVAGILLAFALLGFFLARRGH
jgi:hypothetical protein